MKEYVTHGVSFGSALAITISWSLHHSILWAILQGFLGGSTSSTTPSRDDHADPIAHARRLDEEGYVPPDGFIAPPHRRIVERTTLFAEEGETAGSEFRQEPGARRLANPADKGTSSSTAWSTRRWASTSLTCSAALQAEQPECAIGEPHSAQSQPSVDAGALPDEVGYWVQHRLAADDFTTENGALRVVPGSHRSGQRPQDVLADPEHTQPDEVLVTGRAGDVVVMNSHLWHGGTANRTGGRRLALHAFYCRGDKPQQQYQKALLRPETVAALSPAARAMLALDDPGNDALSAEGGRSGFMK
jgi:hypothetical protein